MILSYPAAWPMLPRNGVLLYPVPTNLRDEPGNSLAGASQHGTRTLLRATTPDTSVV
jgi:hypothetical protein